MIVSITVLIACALVLTFFSLRAHVLAESTNPNHVTLSDRAYSGTLSWCDLLRIRVESLVALTIDIQLVSAALRCVFSFTRTETARWYCELETTLDSIKEIALRDQGTVLE